MVNKILIYIRQLLLLSPRFSEETIPRIPRTTHYVFAERNSSTLSITWAPFIWANGRAAIAPSIFNNSHKINKIVNNY